jgi:hypothetical protein
MPERTWLRVIGAWVRAAASLQVVARSVTTATVLSGSVRILQRDTTIRFGVEAADLSL